MILGILTLYYIGKIIQKYPDTTMAITAVIGIILGVYNIIAMKKQIYRGNNQFLFDKRLKLYEKYLSFLKLLSASQTSICSFLGPDFNVRTHLKFIISDLTNNAELEFICKNWSEEEYPQDDHIKFLSKIEEIHLYAQEARVVYSDKNGEKLEKFFNNYADLLRWVYRMRALDGKNPSCYNQIIEEKKRLKQLNNSLCKISEQINKQTIEKELKII